MSIIKEIGQFDGKTFPNVSKQLGRAMRYLLDASDNYLKEKCYRLSKQCLNMVLFYLFNLFLFINFTKNDFPSFKMKFIKFNFILLFYN